MSRLRNGQETQLSERRKDIQDLISELDDKIYSLETNYLCETQNYGNLLIGWESYLNSKFQKNASQNAQKKSSKLQEKDRLFSLTSMDSRAARKLKEELEKTARSISGDKVHSSYVKKRMKKRGGRGDKEGVRGSKRDGLGEDDEDFIVRERLPKGRKKSKNQKEEMYKANKKKKIKKKDR